MKKLTIDMQIKLANTITPQEVAKFVNTNCTSVFDETSKAIGTFQCMNKAKTKVLYCGIIVEDKWDDGTRLEGWVDFNNPTSEDGLWPMLINTTKPDEYIQKFVYGIKRYKND